MFPFLFADIQNDAIITTIGIAAGVALGAISIYERLDERHYKTIRTRLLDEEKESNLLRTKIHNYEQKYGPLT